MVQQKYEIAKQMEDMEFLQEYSNSKNTKLLEDFSKLTE